MAVTVHVIMLGAAIHRSTREQLSANVLWWIAAHEIFSVKCRPYAVPSVSKLSHWGMNILIPQCEIYSSWGVNIFTLGDEIFTLGDEIFALGYQYIGTLVRIFHTPGRIFHSSGWIFCTGVRIFRPLGWIFRTGEWNSLFSKYSSPRTNINVARNK